MKQEKNEVLLTVKELQAIGTELNDLINEVDLLNIIIESLEMTKRNDQATFMMIVSKYLNSAYILNEKLSCKLDQVAFKLLNINNENVLGDVKNGN